MSDELISGSRLERVLRAGYFAVTAELNPPDSADPQEVYDAALVLSEVCDGINATDAAGAHCHMSSIAICAILLQAGYDPVLQVSCRDRNRIAIQGDLLGAAAMGVKNVLLLQAMMFLWVTNPKPNVFLILTLSIYCVSHG